MTDCRFFRWREEIELMFRYIVMFYIDLNSCTLIFSNFRSSYPYLYSESVLNPYLFICNWNHSLYVTCLTNKVLTPDVVMFLFEDKMK